MTLTPRAQRATLPLVLRREAASFKKFAALARFATPVIGIGILASEGDLHRRQRRIIAPGLAKNRIAEYVRAMARHIDEAVARWRRTGRIDVMLAQ